MSASKTPEIVIYHVEGRRSLRVVWTCEELELPYKLVFKQGDILGSLVQIRNAHPSMPITPVVAIDGVHMVESGAIIEALATRYGNGRMVPDVHGPDYLHYLQWLHFAEATLMSRLAQNRFISIATRIPVNALPPGYRNGKDAKDAIMMVGPEQSFQYADEFLAEKPFFGGADFSVADVAMHYALRGAKLMVGIDTSEYPNVQRWRERVEARPSFPRAVKAACPTGMNEYLLPEGHPLPFKPVGPLGFGGRLTAKVLSKLMVKLTDNAKKQGLEMSSQP